MACIKAYPSFHRVVCFVSTGLVNFISSRVAGILDWLKLKTIILTCTKSQTYHPM